MCRKFGLSFCSRAVSFRGSSPMSPRQIQGAFDRKVDVVYGRKFGTALTMDVFTPKANANGAAVVWVVSGGWFSAHEAINPGFIAELLNRGYTVFAVVHGSQPRFTIPEIVKDMNRAVRFIRYHAKDYHIDPDRIGITGGIGRRAPVAHAGNGRRHRRQECQGPRRPDLQPGPGGRLLLSAHRFSQLRQARRDRDRLRRAQGLQAAVRLPRARPEHQDVRPDHRHGQDPRDRPPDQPGLSCLVRRPAHADHPRRCRSYWCRSSRPSSSSTSSSRRASRPSWSSRKGPQHGWPDLLKDMAIIADWFDAHLKAHEADADKPKP